MKRQILVVMLLTFAGLAIADKAGPIKQTYKADKIAADVYVIHGPKGLPSPQNQGFMNNPGFLITKAGVVVIDPGSSVQTGEMVLSHIRKLTDKPVVAIFDTHVHGDHWLGNQAIREAYPKVTIYGHPNMIQEVEDGAGETWLETMMTLTEGATAGTNIVSANSPLDNEAEIKIGGLTFKIIHLGKAHTNTDIMIHVVEPDIVFLGDNAGYERTLRLAGGSVAGNIKVLNAALALKAKIYVPGHGRTGGSEAASSYRDYFQTIYSGVEKYFEQDLTDFEIKPLLLPEMARWHDWVGFDEEFGKHVNTAYLEVEAAAF